MKRRTYLLSVFAALTSMVLAGCGKEIDEPCDHIDNNRDHLCDLCHDRLSECVDKDKDHFCDYCDRKISDHTYVYKDNKVHVCSTCGKTEECYDKNGDGKCDACNTVFNVDSKLNLSLDYDKIKANLSGEQTGYTAVAEIKSIDGHPVEFSSVCINKLCDSSIPRYVDASIEDAAKVLQFKNPLNADSYIKFSNVRVSRVGITILSPYEFEANNNIGVSFRGTYLKENVVNPNGTETSWNQLIGEGGVTVKSYNTFFFTGDSEQAGDLIIRNVAKSGARYIESIIIECKDFPAHTCFDNDKDHYCDNCGLKISNHEDKNGDNYCDYCGAIICDHIDTNPKDHFCDICGLLISNCVDANGDGNCDICGQSMANLLFEEAVKKLFINLSTGNSIFPDNPLFDIDPLYSISGNRILLPKRLILKDGSAAFIFWDTTTLGNNVKQIISVSDDYDLVEFNILPIDYPNSGETLGIKVSSITIGNLTYTYNKLKLIYNQKVNAAGQFTFNVCLQALTFEHEEMTIAELHRLTEDGQGYEVIDYEQQMPYFKPTAGQNYRYVKMKGKIVYLTPDNNFAILQNGNDTTEIYFGISGSYYIDWIPELKVGNYVEVYGNLSQYSGYFQLAYVSNISLLDDHSDIEEPTGNYVNFDANLLSSIKLDNGYQDYVVDGLMNSLGTVTGEYVEGSLSTSVANCNQRFTFNIKVADGLTMTIAYDYHTCKNPDGTMNSDIADKVNELIKSNKTVTIKGLIRYNGGGSSDALACKKGTGTGVWTIVPLSANDIIF